MSKLAVIYCGGNSAAWSVSDGVCETLRKMGHQVLPIPRGRAECPRLTPEALNQADAIIVSGPEHIFRESLQGEQPTAYSFREDELTTYAWKHEVTKPKLFWYHESCRRDDTNFRFERRCLPYGDFHFFPAIQDAEMYDQEHFAKGRSFWLPFGADTDVFKPLPCPECMPIHRKALHDAYDRGEDPLGVGPTPAGQMAILKHPNMQAEIACKECLGSGWAKSPKTCDIGFIGMMYQKRQGWLNSYAKHMKEGDPGLAIGNVFVQDIEGIPWKENAVRLAANYRRIAVFLNFPHLSELLVTKVYEVLACGTFLLTPLLTGSAERNCDHFKHPKRGAESEAHLAYFNPSNLPFVAQMAREFFSREKLREQIAMQGMLEVRAKHSLKHRLEEMLAKSKVLPKLEIVQ